MFESGSGRFPNIYSTNSTSTIENLQAQLKQFQGNFLLMKYHNSTKIAINTQNNYYFISGEIQQLQWELSRRNNERDALRTEVSTLSINIEDLQQSVTEIGQLRESLKDIQTKYDALLQMYGEKVEENEELRLDLEDVKEVYKSQIDQLLKRDL